MTRSYLTPDEVAAEFRVSRGWVMARCRDGRINALRLDGKLWRISRAALDKFLREIEWLNSSSATAGPTVCVGRGLPAIPVDDTFWGHTSVPPEGFEWWRTLPTYGSQP